MARNRDAVSVDQLNQMQRYLGEEMIEEYQEGHMSRREMLKRSLALKRTGEADLLVTNPTHYAIALRYRHGEMAAPKLVAKGAGTMAAAMRAIAARHRIPVVQNVTLARALYAHAGLDEDLPSVYFPEVARLMVWVLAMRESGHRAAAGQGARA